MANKSENFLKSFGMGLVYFLLFPFIVIGSALLAVWGILRFIFSSFGGIVRFFKGEEFFPTLREDKEVALVIKTQHDVLLNGAPAPKQEAPAPAPNNNNVYVQNNYYSKPLDNQNNTQSPNQIQGTPMPNGQYLNAAQAPTPQSIPTQNPQQIPLNQVQIPQQNRNNFVSPSLNSFPTYDPPKEAKIEINPLKEGGNDHDAR